jgi:ADP-ribose pyrophosphatase YjhB (NUDIX family)
MLQPRYTDDPQFALQPKFMSDAAMAEYLSARPTVNADVIFMRASERAVYLPTRRSKPADGLWLIGGARKAGETSADTAVRRLKAETALDIDQDRLRLIGIIEFVWSYRKEAPSGDGRHDINWVHALEVSDEELAAASARLDPAEYDAAAGFAKFTTLDQLRDAGARTLLADLFTTLFPD